MTTCHSPCRRYTDGRHFQLLEGLPQLQGVQGSWLVILQELRPPASVGWVVNRERCKDGNPDGIRDLIALSEPPVTAADGKRYDGSYQRTGYRAQQCKNSVLTSVSAGSAP